MSRTAHIHRVTGETDVSLSLGLDGSGTGERRTGLGFFDHLLDAVARHGGLDLDVGVRGDLETGPHHTVEDTGIALGQALGEALGDKAGLRRFGDATVPLDEARARAVVDLGGRPYLVWDVQVGVGAGELGAFHPLQARHMLEGLVANARINLHVLLEAGDLPHHCLESCFKAIARALGDAVTPDPRAGSGSTKGTLT